MSSSGRTAALVLLLGLSSAAASAQRVASPTSNGDWTHGSTLSISGGVATDSTDTGATAGAAIGWELTPRVEVEGSGLWLDRTDGSDGFNAALKVRAGLRGAGVSPFVEGGFGLYHVTVKTSGTMPEFYERRMTGTGVAPRSFTDPVFHFGAGVNVFTSRHVALQPAIEGLLVTADGHAYTLGAFSLRLVYHFEDHPVTPQR